MRSRPDASTVTFDNGTMRESFLSCGSFRHLLALNEFVETSGALNGLEPNQTQAVCVDLVWKVSLLVTEAVNRNLEEVTGRELQLSCS